MVLLADNDSLRAERYIEKTMTYLNNNSIDMKLCKLSSDNNVKTTEVYSIIETILADNNNIRDVKEFVSGIIYDPTQKTAVTEQTFSEGLGDRTHDSNAGLNAVSVYLPNGLPASGSDSSQNRNYNRTAKETQYGVSKTQISEYSKSGLSEIATLPGSVHVVVVQITKYTLSRPSNLPLSSFTLNLT